MSSSPLPRLSDQAQDALAAYREASPGSQRRAANLRAVHERVRAEASPPAAAAAGLLWPLGWGMASAAAAAVLVWGLVEARSVGEEAPRARTEAPAVVALEKPSRAESQVESPRSPIAPEGSVESAAVQRPTKRSVRDASGAFRCGVHSSGIRSSGGDTPPPGGSGLDDESCVEPRRPRARRIHPRISERGASRGCTGLPHHRAL